MPKIKIDDSPSIKRSSGDRETDVADLTALIGRAHLERCSACDRYKYTVEICPHCTEVLLDTFVGRYVQSVFDHQVAARNPAHLRELGPLPLLGGHPLAASYERYLRGFRLSARDREALEEQRARYEEIVAAGSVSIVDLSADTIAKKEG